MIFRRFCGLIGGYKHFASSYRAFRMSGDDIFGVLCGF